MGKLTQSFLDRLSISFSAICAMHCAFFPLMLAVFPSITIISVDDQVFHEVLVGLVLPSSMIAAYLGCSRHKDRMALFGIGLGLATFVITANFGHELLGEKGERATTIVAATILAWSHWRNFSLCRKDSCSHNL